MKQGPHHPQVGELWQLTDLTALSLGGKLGRVPAGTTFLVLSRHEWPEGWESRVLFASGIIGNLFDRCPHMVRISDAAR